MQKFRSKAHSNAGARPPVPPAVIAAYRLQVAGRIAEAEAAYRDVLASQPGQYEALELLAGLCRQRGDLAEALRLFAATMKADRGSAEAASNHGVVLNELGRPDEALLSLDRALVLKPDFVPALYNRGNALFALDRFEEAVRSYDRALACEPSHVDAHYNRGNALRELRRHDDALASYRRALALAPDRADIRVNEALTLLRMGDLAQGFRLYEARRKGAPAIAVPQWTGGEPVAGKTVLIHAEQGFGDTLQFIRYAPLLAARGAAVVAAVPPPLKALLAASMPQVTVVTAGDAAPAFDLHCPMLSLPLAFATDAATIPAQVPYLTPPPDRVAYWGSRLPATTQRRVGIVWAGNAGFAGNRPRSLAFTALAGLLDTPGCTFIGLQREVPPDDVEAVRAASNFVNFGPELADFADTAALMSQLDLIIGVDTGPIHLAGALGKPVWVLLAASPDFRWMLDRPDSPWYPTATLFRQARRGDWNEVIARVRTTLANQPVAAARDDARAHDAKADDAKADYGGIDARRRDAADLLARGHYADALAAWDDVITADPGCADVHNSRGTTLAALGRFADADEAFARAIALAPGFAAAIYNQGLVELTLGRLASGWAKYERRFEANGVAPPAGAPRWTGAEPLAGKTLLVEAEQGFGDTFMFSRYVPLAAAAGAQVILSVPRPVLPVMKTLGGVTRLLCAGQPAAPALAYDLACPLLSLPHAFRTDLDTIPAQVPYLAAERERIAYWGDRLPPGRRRIGIVWAGSAGFAADRHRSLPFCELAPLFATPDATFVGLQRDLPAGDADAVGAAANFANLGGALRDFADTAAIIAQLDLVIAIDTAVAHLAGAMGRPVWILLPFAPDFRWLLDRSDSPWYPTARLFRQQAIGDWTEVIGRVAAALGDASS